MAVYETGQAAIRILPDLTGFHRRTAAELKAKPLRTQVQILPSMQGFSTALKTQLKAITASLPVTIDPDMSGFAGKLQTRLAAIDAEFSVQIIPELGADFQARLRSLSTAASGHSIPVEIVPEFASDFQARLRAIAIARGYSIPVGVDLDDGGYHAQIAALLRPRTQPVRIDADRSSLGALTGALKGVGSLVGAAAPIVAVGFAAAGAIGPLGALAAAIGTASGALAVLPALGVAAGAGIAAIAIGANGIGDAFSSMSAATAGADDAARAVESAQQRVESSERGIESAQRNGERAQDRLNDARKTAAQRLRDMNDELKNSALDEESAVLAVERARERLAETNADPGASALDRKEADLGYRQAIASMQAQRTEANDLASATALANQAGIEGSQEVVDAKQGVADATQGQVDAQRDLANAMRDLSEAGNAGGVDKFAESMAKLAPNAQQFVLAIQDLGPAWTDVRKSIQDELFDGMGESVTNLATVQLPVLKDGLGGIAAEINGGLRSAIAQFSTETAALDFETTLGNTRGLFAGIAASMAPISQAFMDIATVGSSFLPSMGDGIAGWASGFADSIAVMRESGELQEMMQSGLDMLKSFGAVLADVGGIVKGVFTAATDASGGAFGAIGQIVDKVNEFVNSVEGQEALGSFFGAITDALSAALPILLDVAEIIGTTFAPAISDLLVSAAPGISALVDGLGAGLEALAPAMGPLGEAIGAIGEALAPVLPVLGEVLGDVITSLAPALGPLAELFASIVEAVLPILPVLADLIGMFVEALAPALQTIVEAIAPVIEQLMEGLAPVLETLAPILADVAATFADALATAIDQLVPLLPPLMEAFMGLVDAVVPLLPPIFDLINELFPPLVEIIGAVVPVVTDVIRIFADLMAVLVPVLIPAIETLADVVGFVFGLIAETITEKINTAKEQFQGLKDGFKAVGEFFGDVGETIGKVFDGVVKGIATAVKAIGIVLQKVEIPDWVPVIGGEGTGPLGDVLVGWADQHLATGGLVAAGRASDGVLFGPGTGTSDSILGVDDHGVPTARVSSGEMVVNEKQTNANLPLLKAINAGWTPPVEMLYEMLPGFASGGQVTARGMDDFGRPLDGKDYLLGGWSGSFQDTDCSGAVAAFSNFAVGLPPFGERFATGTQGQELANRGFVPGLGPRGSLNVGWFNGGPYGGHTALTLPSGTNAEMGGARGNGQFGGAAAGGDHPSFTDHAHLPPEHFAAAPVVIPDAGIRTPTDPSSGMPESGTYSTEKESKSGPGKLPTVGELAGDAATETVGGIFEFFGLEDTVFYDPNKSLLVRGAQAATKNQDASADTVAGEVIPSITPVPIPKGQALADSPVIYDPVKGAAQWRPTIEKALTMMGSPLSNLNRTEQQVDIESSGNPGAQNLGYSGEDGSHPAGLLQTLQSTFDAMVHPDLAGLGREHPLANLTAGIGWAINRWGGPEKIWPTRAGYAGGGWISGPGTSTSDSVPIDASTGEFMVRAAKAQRWGPVLEAMNSGALDAAIASGRGSAALGSGPAEVHQHFGSINTFSEPAAVREFRREVRAGALSDAIA